MKPGPDDFTDTDQLEREREDSLKFVIALKPTLSLVYFPKPSGFRSKAFEGGSDPGRLYIDTVELAGRLEHWQSDGGEVPVIRHLVWTAALIQFSRLQADRTTARIPVPPPSALGRQRTHIPTSVLC